MSKNDKHDDYSDKQIKKEEKSDIYKSIESYLRNGIGQKIAWNIIREL